MKTPDFVLDLDVIRQQLRQQVKADSGKTAAPNTIQKYYKAENVLLWVDRTGVDSKADTLLKWLNGAGELGMKASAFQVDEIERDMKRLRTLDFDTQNSINTVVARLEYNLTKAFARYLSVYGPVESGWKRENGKTEYTLSIPSNCSAEIRLPDGTEKTVGAGAYCFVQ